MLLQQIDDLLLLIGFGAFIAGCWCFDRIPTPFGTVRKSEQPAIFLVYIISFSTGFVVLALIVCSEAGFVHFMPT